MLTILLTMLPHPGCALDAPERRTGLGVMLGLLLAVMLAAGAPVLPAQKTGNLKAAHDAMTAGLAAAHGGDLEAARRDFARAVELAPKVSATHAALGSVLLAQNDLDAAQRELGLAHELDPADVSVDLNLARAKVGARQFPAAVVLFHDALAADPAPVLNEEESIACATALAATGETGSAETVLRAALARGPDSAPLSDALGTLLAQGGHMDQALPLFEQAVAVDAGFTQAQYHLGVTRLSLNRAEEALGPLELAVGAGGSAASRFDMELQLGRALSALHRDDQALEHLHRAAGLMSAATSGQSLYALALALQASGDAKSALPLFEAALADPELASGLAGGAAAGSLLSSALSSALINAALAHVQTGDTVRALPLYARALELGPDTATLREDFGVAYLQQSDLNHAMEQFRAGLALEPENAHLHYDLGLALKLKDDLAGAIPELEYSAELDPTLPDPAYTLGIIYMQQGNFAAGAKQLKSATALQPENGNAWALLGSVLKDAGDPSGAADALRHAVALQPDQPNLHIQLAVLEAQAGQMEAAAADRKIAADLSRASITRQRASFALKSARALLEENKLPEAILQLNTAALADPTMTEPHTLLANAYSRQGKAADAALERQKATEIDRQRGAVGRP